VIPRHETVLQAVQEQDRHADLRHVESPGACEGEVVVEPAVDARPGRFAERLAEEVLELWEDGVVGRREQRLEAWPANQSRPSASYGAGPPTAAAATTRSGRSAAQTSACGAPPEMPHVANRSTSSSSASAATPCATEATSRPAARDASPYPGRW
jgi:hypothetical protein